MHMWERDRTVRDNRKVWMGLKKQRGTRPGGDARQKLVGGGVLILPEEGVTQDNLQKWDQQNRDRSADCQKLSAKQG